LKRVLAGEGRKGFSSVPKRRPLVLLKKMEAPSVAMRGISIGAFLKG